MTAPVVTVGRETPFKGIVVALVEHDVSGLPVVEDGAVDRVSRAAQEEDLRLWAGIRPLPSLGQ